MDEHLAVALVERSERGEQLVAPLVRQHGRLGGRSRVPRGRRRGAEHEPSAPTGRAAPVVRLVRDDPQEPRAERCAFAKTPECPIRLDEAVLHSLLRVGAIAGGDERDTECDRLVHAYELLVGGGVAVLGAHDERRLVKWPAHHPRLLHPAAHGGSGSVERVDEPWSSLRISDVHPIPVAGGLRWRPIRRTLGIEAFGMNAYTAETAGDEVVESHTEQTLGHQEVYVVLSGRATFELNGDTLDAPAGTVVFLRDPSTRRHAHAAEPGTTVLAVGGKPGEAYTPSAWEWYFEAERFRDPLDPEAALRLMDEANERFPDNAGVVYSTACWLALAGKDDEALETLRRAVELEPRAREWAAGDDDLVSVRDRL